MSDSGPVHIDEKDRRRAMRAIQHVWRDLVRQLVESAVAHEDELQGTGFSYAYQEMEDRFGQRLFLASQMLGAIQHAGPPARPPAPPEFKVIRVEGPLEELDTRINARLADLRGHLVHGIEIASDDDELWHAFVTLSLPG